MKYNIKTLIIILILAGVISAQENVDPISILLEKNRNILAAKEAYNAAIERVKTLGVLPDPMIETNYFLTPIETRNGPMESQIMLGQKFPLWGKLSRQKKIAYIQADIVALNLKNKEIMVVFQMSKDWANYVKLSNSLNILNEYRSELESFRSIALTQYSTGVGMTQHPILKLQIEMSLIESQINLLESNLETVINDLQALFDGQFTTEIFGSEWGVDLPHKLTDEWLEQAQRIQPSYLTALKEQKIATLQNELAVRKNYPDLVTGLTYTMIGDEAMQSAANSGGDAFGFKIGLNLPIWFKRNKARIESTKFKIKSKEEMTVEIWNQVQDDILSIAKQYNELDETFQLYETKLVQESEQMLSSAFSAYETGKISFLDLLDSERMVVRVRLDFERIIAEKWIAGAQMIKAVGLVRLEEK